MYKMAEDDPSLTLEEVAPLAVGAVQALGMANETYESAMNRLASSLPAAVFLVLRHEPAALVAQILAAHEWEWREGMLSLYSREQREKIADSAIENAPALLNYAIQNLVERLV